MKLRLFNKNRFQKVTQLFSIVLIVIFSLSSCDEGTTPTEPINNSLNKIMPLGASRVEGARPVFESYRYELWKSLVDGNWEFDYIGTNTDRATYPGHSGLSFDTDHEGRGGWTSGQILSNINSWLEETGAPDIVLFSSPGGNDIISGQASYAEIISNINDIVDILQSVNPDVTIIIEQLAPGKDSFMTPEFNTAFNNMKEDVVEIASQQTTTTSKVLTVDMFTGFDDSHLADDIHYNEKGASFIATRYYDILQTVLTQ